MSADPMPVEEQTRLAEWRRQHEAALTVPETSIDAAFKVQPHNVDAEQELLGAIMVNNAAIEGIGDLQAGHFFHEAHRRIFDACRIMIARGDIANPVTLKAFFDRDEVIAKAGGTSYLARLAAAATTIINAPDYAKAIKDLALRREMIGIGQDMIARAFDPKVEDAAADLLRRFQGDLEAAVASADTDDLPVHTLADLSQRAMEHAQSVARGEHFGIRTGLADLDAKFGGMAGGHLIIMAGRPSMGKTALAFQFAKNAARAGKKILVFEHEMSGEELAERSLAERSGIHYVDMRTDKAAQLDFNRLLAAQRAEEKLPIFICDRPNLTVPDMRRVARREIRRRGGIDMMLVDHLGLVRARQVYRNRYEAITEITQDLKGLAKELGVPVIALCQLSRAVESREDKRPELQDLKDSGSIEQDADAVLFIFREEYYEQRKQPKPGTPEYDAWEEKMHLVRGIAEVIIGKQRQGPIGKSYVRYDAPTNKFTDIGQPADPRQADMAFDLAGQPPAHATEFAPVE